MAKITLSTQRSYYSWWQDGKNNALDTKVLHCITPIDNIVIKNNTLNEKFLFLLMKTFLLKKTLSTQMSYFS